MHNDYRWRVIPCYEKQDFWIDHDDDNWSRVSHNSQKFWMITGDGNQPRVRHTNKKLATNEAERLARANPGTKFYLLEAVEVFEQPNDIRREKL